MGLSPDDPGVKRPTTIGGGIELVDALGGSSSHTVEGAVEAEDTLRACEKIESCTLEEDVEEEDEEVLKERRGWLTWMLK